MNKKISTGAVIFLIGLIIVLIYSIYPVFRKNEEAMLFGMKIGFIIMGIGAVILIVFLCFERHKEYKKFKKEIKEEDLRP